jgi:hypothetical protein
MLLAPRPRQEMLGSGLADGDSEMIAPWGLSWYLEARRAQLQRARQALAFRRQVLDQRSKLIDTHYNLLKEKISSLGTQTEGGGDGGDPYSLSED